MASSSMFNQAVRNACFSSLKALEMKEVPWWEQGAITDDLLQKIVNCVLDEADSNRAVVLATIDQQKGLA